MLEWLKIYSGAGSVEGVIVARLLRNSLPIKIIPSRYEILINDIGSQKIVSKCKIVDFRQKQEVVEPIETY